MRRIGQRHGGQIAMCSGVTLVVAVAGALLTGGFGTVLTGTLYGLVDGAIGGWLVARLYNLAAGSGG